MPKPYKRIYLTNETFTVFKKIAKTEGLTIGQVATKAISNYTENIARNEVVALKNKIGYMETIMYEFQKTQKSINEHILNVLEKLAT